MGLWEQMHNPDFNVTEFSYIKNEAGSNGFVLSSKQWIEKTNAIGLITKSGRYVGALLPIKILLWVFVIGELRKSQCPFNKARHQSISAVTAIE